MKKSPASGSVSLISLLIATALLFEICITPAEPCQSTSTTPQTTETTTFSSSTSQITTTTPSTCTVGTKPFGVFDPAPGSVVPDGSIVIVVCNPATHTSTSAVLSAKCTNGELTPTSSCDPCPDTTWIFDDTTNRCFKGFTAFSSSPCNSAAPCAAVGLTENVPGGLAYTSNFQALIDAGTLAINSVVTPSNEYFVGIGDANGQSQYQLSDGTPVVLTDILPFFITGQPDDNPTNQQTFMVVRSGFTPSGGTNGFDDTTCSTAFGAICQLQLTK